MDVNNKWSNDFKNSFSAGDGFSGNRKSSQNMTQSEKPRAVTGTIFDKFVSFSMAALFFGLPIFFTGATFQGISFEKQIYFYVFLLIGIIAWTAKGMMTGRMIIRKTPLDIPIMIFVAAYFLSTFFSVDKWHSFWGFFGDPSRGLAGVLALTLAYYFLVSNYSIKRLKISLMSLAVSGALVSAWSLLILLKIGFMPQELASYAPFSLMGSVGGLSLFIAFMIPILLTLFAKNNESSERSLSKTIGKLFLPLNVAINLVILLMIYSYTSWLSVIIGVGLYMIFILSRMVTLSAKGNFLAMFVFAGIMMIMMVGQNKIARINLPIEATPSFGLSWDIAKKSLEEKIFLGSGAGTYGYAFSKYKPVEFNENQLQGVRFYQGTGLFFESLSTLGIVGTFAAVLLALSFVSVAMYALLGGKGEERVYSLGLVSSSMIILSGFVLNAIDGALLVIGGLVFALAVATLLKEGGSEEKFVELDLKASPKYALALAFVFMVISAGVAFVFIFIGKVFVADVYAGLAVKAGKVSEDESIWKLKKAVSLNTREGRYFTRIGQEYMILSNTEMLKNNDSGNIDLRNGYARSAILFASEGRKRMASDALANEVLAKVLENSIAIDSGLLDDAQDAYIKTLEIEPNNPFLMLKIAQIKMATAERATDQAEKDKLNAQAREDLLRAMELKKNFSQGYYNLALLQHNLKETDEAIQNMAKAANFDKSNDGYKISLSRMLVLRSKDKDLESAENILKGILQNNNQNAIAHLDLGLLYEKTNRDSEARKSYERALELVSPEAEKEKEGIRKLIENVGKSNATPAVEVEIQEEQPIITP